MEFIEQLSKAASIHIQQRKELAELFGFETRNKYLLESDGVPIGFAAEQQKGWLGFLARQLLGHWRTFEIHIFDQNRKPVLDAHHPFRWFFKRLDVRGPDKHLIGSIQQRFSVFSKRLDVLDERGRVLMIVKSPLFSIWTFRFMKNGNQAAIIRKKWGGLLKEAFTDADRFELAFEQPHLMVNERLLLLAAALFIDLQYFEVKQ